MASISSKSREIIKRTKEKLWSKGKVDRRAKRRDNKKIKKMSFIRINSRKNDKGKIYKGAEVIEKCC